MKVILSSLFYMSLFLSCQRIKQPVINGSQLDSSSLNEDFRYIQGLTNQLGLYKIDKHLDGFEFRFWIMEMVDDDRLIVIKRDSLGSSCKEYVFKRDSVSEGKKVLKDMNNVPNTVDSAFMSLIKPKIDVQNLIDTLLKFDLLNTPTQKQIPNYQQIVVGKYYIYEIAADKSYKLLRYDYPDLYEDYYNSKMTRLVLFIERQLGPFSYPL